MARISSEIDRMAAMSSATIDTAISAYLSVADGELTARQALVAIATLLERDERDLLERAQPIVTRLVETGFLVRT